MHTKKISVGSIVAAIWGATGQRYIVTEIHGDKEVWGRREGVHREFYLGSIAELFLVQ